MARPNGRITAGGPAARTSREPTALPLTPTTGIVLAPPPSDAGQVHPANTVITLSTSDIDATHAAMAAPGADVDAQVSRMGEPVPPMFWFRDPSGHTMLVVES